MEWPKVKNIIIVILLFVNGFLLILVGGQFLRERYSRHAALTNAALILEQNGISTSEEALAQISSTALLSMTAERDLDAERSLAEQLLGPDTVCTDQSGGLYVYSSSAGTVIFRANGECTVTFETPPVTNLPCSDHALDFLRRLGLSGELLSCREASDQTTVVLHQLLGDIPLYSCRVEFVYTDCALTSIQGTFLLTAEPPSPLENEPALDATTALIRFLSAVLESGDLCSSVTAIRPGYLLIPSFGSSSYLHPVWLVTTNVSQYYLDGITGELSRAA